MKVAVIGLGIVALADAIVFARKHEVVVTGPVPDRVDAINARIFPLDEPDLAEFLAGNALNLRATLDTVDALRGADLVLVSAPISRDPETGMIRTVELESRIEFVHRHYPNVPIVIRSAVPVGFCDQMRQTLRSASLVYVPEFRREGNLLADALNPGFLIVGDRGELGARVGAALAAATDVADLQIHRMGAAEAEAVKHFSQAYLAARVAFFNECDTFAMQHGLDARLIIDAVTLDPRIGGFARNPCFGFSGQRLPQSLNLLSQAFMDVPARVMNSVTSANDTRITLLASKVLEKTPRHIGVYNPQGTHRGSDTITQLQDRLRASGTRVTVFDRIAGQGDPEFEIFKRGCDVIVANRMSPELRDIRDKVFCRDLYATG